MSTEGKILTFPVDRTKKGTESSADPAPIVDMVEKRQEILQDERRSVKRTLLTEFIGVHTVVPGAGLQRCSLHDISVTGLSFDLAKKQGHFHVGEEVSLRVYLNHQTYFSFLVKVRSQRFVDEDDVYRHGAAIVEGTGNQKAIEHFIGFIESVSASLRTDRGDVIVSNLDQP